MDNVKCATPNTNNSPVSPKMWGVLTDSEKLERMREMIKGMGHMQRELNKMSSSIQTLRKIIINHDHVNGKVVDRVPEYETLPYGYGDISCNTLTQKPNDTDVYF